MREIADPVEPTALHPAFHALFQSVKEAQRLEPFRFLKHGFLVSIDGTGQFSSSSIGCPDCATKTSRNGETLYYHQLLAAVIVHPDLKQVLPLIPEPILGGDGETKNDCEQVGLDHNFGQFPHAATGVK
jgi:hypothetical protein